MKALRVEDLKPFHLTGWLDKSYANAGNNYRRSAIRSVQRAFNWAVKEGYLEKSPVAHVQKPPYIPRDVLITSEQWQSLVSALEARGDRGRALLELLTLLRETGCRPLEARTAEARHLDRIGRCLVFERSESKGHGGSHTVERRVVPLTDAMFAVCERRAKNIRKTRCSGTQEERLGSDMRSNNGSNGWTSVGTNGRASNESASGCPRIPFGTPGLPRHLNGESIQ